MASLRTRVLVSVLVLSAAGLVALAAVTYADQRSFLEGRINQQVKGAAPAMSQALDARGYLPAGTEPFGGRGGGGNRGRGGGFNRGPGGGGLGPDLPPGTYGERREASGKVIGQPLEFSYGQTAPPAPRFPAHIPLYKLITVGSVGSSGLQYRAYMVRDPEDTGLTLVAIPLREVSDTLNRLLLVEGLVIGGVLLALGLTAFFVVRLGLRPLDRIGHTADQIAAGDLSHRVQPATQRTEVGRLGLALNAMLDRLEQAFSEREQSQQRLRQFLADASHELRTPLTAIRGYAELFRMGAAREPADVEHSMRRIEAEARRMGVLVSDLLTLARMDEAPTREHQRVELAALAQDAVEDAHATAPDREITLAAAPDTTVVGDSHQLRQVLANLIRNALVHTPADSPIEVGVQRDSDSVVLTVRDHGPGLPGGSAERLFERFWRAEGGRERGRAGAGLGLAIVDGLVKAHHGQISAHNADGGGALFTVRLPAAAAPAPAQAPVA
ncbi:MAG TPA: HAMP domain-containing sensor histidine kinase [Solirubrobacteraceae bacterium]|jgi:two-component system OmpR family sensor kinase|nr:HAMP domain-containing sensor histidine kinase [Solirubrobacteraceae bacterium]